MTACRTELTLRPDELLSTHLQVAERDTTVVGLVQVKVTGTDADLLKLFVEPAQIRSGVGRLLFGWAAARARGLGAVRMIIEADPGAAPFERMGARYAGFAASFQGGAVGLISSTDTNLTFARQNRATQPFASLD